MLLSPDSLLIRSSPPFPSVLQQREACVQEARGLSFPSSCAIMSRDRQSRVRVDVSSNSCDQPTLRWPDFRFAHLAPPPVRSRQGQGRKEGIKHSHQQMGSGLRHPISDGILASHHGGCTRDQMSRPPLHSIRGPYPLGRPRMQGNIIMAGDELFN